MFDLHASGAAAAADHHELQGWLERLAADVDLAEDAALVDEIEALERVKCAAAARQARLTVAFDNSQRAAQRATGVRAERVGRGIASQVGLARHDSPHKGARHLGLAQTLVAEMPHTLAALQRGDTSEWRATLMARETAYLSREHRAAVDATVGPRLPGLGDRQVWAQARAEGYRLDPAAALRRVRGAQSDRRVTMRPAPDLMGRVTGVVPVKQAVAAYAALKTTADRLKAQGDERSRGQIMADEFATRLTGTSHPENVGAEVQLVVDSDTLFAPPSDQHPAGSTEAGAEESDSAPESAEEPGWLHGYGPVPAAWIRNLVRDATANVWLRRVFARPTDGSMVAMESTRRVFPERLREMLIVRDQTCRTPWCDAPIRHADHIRAHTDGGATDFANGQGLCMACNLAKQAPGWSATPLPEAVQLTTPTGHIYYSHAPPLPGSRRRCHQHRPRYRQSPPEPGSYLEHALGELVATCA